MFPPLLCCKMMHLNYCCYQMLHRETNIYNPFFLGYLYKNEPDSFLYLVVLLCSLWWKNLLLDCVTLFAIANKYNLYERKKFTYSVMSFLGLLLAIFRPFGRLDTTCIMINGNVRNSLFEICGHLKMS